MFVQVFQAAANTVSPRKAVPPRYLDEHREVVPNPAYERTRHYWLGLAVISFWAKPSQQLRAAQGYVRLLNMKPCFLLVVFALLTCESAFAEWTADFKGSGPIEIGMSLQTVNLSLGENLRKADIPGPDPTGKCFQVDLTKKRGVELMFIDDKLIRIDVYKTGIQTAEGVRVGDSEDAVLRAYGTRTIRSAHAYVEDGSYLTVLDASRKHGIRFEIENARVVKFYTGLVKAIEYIEGCA